MNPEILHKPLGPRNVGIEAPTCSDMVLHSLSLQIAAAYHLVELDISESEKTELINAYRAVRRIISKNVDGDRFGSDAAHRMMRMGTI